MKKIIDLIKKYSNLNLMLESNNHEELLAKKLAARMAVYAECEIPLKSVKLFPEKENQHIDDTVYCDPLESEVLLARESKILLMDILVESILTKNIDTKSIELKLNKINKDYECEFLDYQDMINCMCRYLKIVVIFLKRQYDNIEHYAEFLLEEREIVIKKDFPNNFTDVEDYIRYCY